MSIRLVRDDDAAAIQTIYAPIVSDTIISFELVIPEVDEFIRRIRYTLPKHPWLVCERDGMVAGYAYASVYRARPAYQWAAEVSVYVHPQHHRRGIARALYTSLFAVLRLQGYVTVYAGIALPNDASVAAHKAVGFGPVGVFRNAGYKFGAWHDVAWWQRSLCDPPAEPVSPRPVDACADDAGWHAALDAGLHHLR